MPNQDEEFIRKLRATFQVEADEHLKSISSLLLELEKSPQPPAQAATAVETIRREAHSLKGASRAVDLTDVEAICQVLESIFSGWKSEATTPPAQTFDALHAALDAISELIVCVEDAAGGNSRRQREQIIQRLKQVSSSPRAPGGGESNNLCLAGSLAGRVEAVESPTPPAPAPPTPSVPTRLASEPAKQTPAPAEKTAVVETVRIPVAKLEAHLLEAEGLLALKSASWQRAAELRSLAGQFNRWNKEWAKVAPEIRLLRRDAGCDQAASVRLLEFLDWNLHCIRTLQNSTSVLASDANQDRHGISRRVDDLLEDSKKLLMLPFSTLTDMFPKLVRDLCRDQEKEADLIIRGGEIEIDKRILEEMKDALIHTLRNCIDHGIEKPEQRARSGKPPRAAITLSVSRTTGNKVEIVVSDDGAGIDVRKVKESAVRQRLISEGAARTMSEAEALSLIFQSGVSTSAIITEISGRGLGMAIVRAKTERLGGQVSIESRPRAGTVLRLTLPLTLATFRGVMVEAAGQVFVVPIINVERVLRILPQEIQTVENRQTISLQGRAVSLARLETVMELPSQAGPAEPAKFIPVIVLRFADQLIAFWVDQILHEEEVLVKPLPHPLTRVRNLAGTTVLGSGKALGVLNIGDLMKSARKYSAPPVPAPSTDLIRQPQAAPRKILIAEDSVTSRMLLKGIFESAGYHVKTAVDGVDAFAALREVEFDLVVSDVEMPRMNGFDLAARIRADKRLSELPVVLVTALESPEQRERGIDAGANAYLNKSSFDQSNLLEVVQRLI